MAVRPNALENRERGMVLEDRAPAPVEGAAPDVAPPDDLQALKGRIRALKLEGAVRDVDPHCRACFERGVKATLRALE
jgi:hypothetical protein